MRKGREFYSKNYDKVIELYNQGTEIKKIAEQLGMSYSAVYHWVKGLRKPEKGNIIKFIEFLKSSGPMPIAEIEDKFPKHNDIFHVAIARKMPIKRKILQAKIGKYNTWYYLEGQEEELENKIKLLKEKIEEIQRKIA
jgi:biotin operon repressor